MEPQQSAETSPGGHTEDPKGDPKQDMDLCRFSSTVKSSNGDPNPQTKYRPYWSTQLPTHCTDQLFMQSSGAHY